MFREAFSRFAPTAPKEVWASETNGRLSIEVTHETSKAWETITLSGIPLDRKDLIHPTVEIEIPTPTFNGGRRIARIKNRTRLADDKRIPDIDGFLANSIEWAVRYARKNGLDAVRFDLVDSSLLPLTDAVLARNGFQSTIEAAPSIKELILAKPRGTT